MRILKYLKIVNKTRVCHYCGNSTSGRICALCGHQGLRNG